MRLQIDESRGAIYVQIVESHGPIHNVEYGDGDLEGPLVNADLEIETGRLVGFEIFGDTEVITESLLTRGAYDSDDEEEE